MSGNNAPTGGKPEDPGHCPFCTLDEVRIFAENDHAVAILDIFPVTPGHTLIIPKRHIVSFFEATAEERVSMFDLARAAAAAPVAV